MQLSISTRNILAHLDALSGSKLTHRSDLGALIELAAGHNEENLLNELSFYAKFISKTHVIMERIGKGAEGYDRLAEEFTGSIGRATVLARSILTHAPGNIRDHFESTYFQMSADGLQNLIALFYDLSWYKNWQLDKRHNSQ